MYLQGLTFNIVMSFVFAIKTIRYRSSVNVTHGLECRNIIALTVKTDK